MMLVTLLTLAITGGLSALMDLRLFRDQAERELKVLASVVGKTCVSALAFNSRESARQRLAALEGEYQARSAVLYDAAGEEFAQWHRLDRAAQPAAMVLEIAQPLSFDGRPIGRLVLTAELSELARQTSLSLRLVVIVAIVAIGLAFALALHLLQRIAGPITTLERSMRQVAERGDFAVRVPDFRAGPEIDTLAGVFNQMLEQLESRDRALRDANAMLRQLAADLTMIEEREKTHLSGQLHDGPMQNLALALLQFAAVADGGCLDEADEDRRQLEAGVQLLREAVAALRTLQFALSPPILAERGLPDALEWLASDTAERWGIAMTATVDKGLASLPARQSAVLYRCARELVNNMVKHAGAGTGAIRLSREGADIVLCVEDDGRGLPAANGRRGTTHRERATGYGLFSIRERIALLGGCFEIHTPAKGARFVVRLAQTPEDCPEPRC
jgi:signal transduction histidine kinase